MPLPRLSHVFRGVMLFFWVEVRSQQRKCSEICNGTGVIQLRGFRKHGAAEPLSLENRNIGNENGVLDVFVSYGHCKPDDDLLTSWSLLVNSSWGNYESCGYQDRRNQCYSNCFPQRNYTSVGRETGGEGSGQCNNATTHLSVGWYSLPTDGHCQRDQAVGFGGCTWGGEHRVRTIHARCLLAKNISCATDTDSRTDFLKKLDAAFASNDPNVGGCPDARSENGDLLIV